MSAYDFHRPDGSTERIYLAGREEWAMDQLLEAGADGCTSIDNPAPRWAHYVWLLRGRGIDIETITEPHGGPFRGTHGRYVLRSHVEAVLAQSAAA